MSAWAKTEPTAASGWVESSMGTKWMRGMATSLVGTWVPQAPQEAMDWIATLPSYEQRDPYYHAARKWPEERIDELATWLDREGTDKRFDSAKGMLAERYIDIDAGIALTLPATIINAAERDRVLVRIAKKLMASDPETVKAWLPDSGLSEQVQARILPENPEDW